jgi:hypothetical protein
VKQWNLHGQAAQTGHLRSLHAPQSESGKLWDVILELIREESHTPVLSLCLSEISSSFTTMPNGVERRVLTYEFCRTMMLSLPSLTTTVVLVR